ncbi:hypothetical protein HS041_28415 [Planomonospora sp. ID67723]|uniref:hypothetical protein n=1 Tax=Planomonospora sp. ID67723 TaxID=2738134 RepID=UPI0018C44C78|nr:hypothetical protein [Planomonospora sp. ID67723]MBG0831659.1 hypothetical protein [Planomonospora sp. ID67723]
MTRPIRLTVVTALASLSVLITSTPASAQPAPVGVTAGTDFLGSLLGQVNNVLSGILSGGALNTILPNGVLSG